MRRRLWITAAVFMTQAGCEAGPTGTEEFASLSELRLQVAVSRDEVTPGDALSVRVSAYNPTRKAVQWPEYECMPLMYRVYTPAGERIGPTGDLKCALIGTSEPIGPELAPGDSLVALHRWSAIGDYGAPGPAQLLDPGAYAVVGGVEGEPELLVESAPDTVWVRVP